MRNGWALMRALSSSARITVLTAGLAGASLLNFVTRLHTFGHVSTGFHATWWMIAGLYYLAEVCLVHLEFRRDSHSFSMSEVPLVLGLLFATPTDLLLGQLIGCAVALGVQRRLSAMKLAFNLANFAFSTTLGVLTFRTLAPTVGTLGVRVWLCVFLATLVSALSTGLTVVVAISLSEGRLQGDRFPLIALMAMFAAVTNASLALIAATLMRTNVLAIALLLVPATTVFLAYRAYLSEREKHESLEFLYASTRILTETPALDEAVVALLTQAREMFRAESAEMLFAPPERSGLLRTRVTAESTALMEPVDDPAVLALWHRLYVEPRTLRLRRGDATGGDLAFLEVENMRDAMVAPLRGETRAFGLVVVSDRVGGVASFDGEDARLFETLANQASVALENGRLEQSLAQLRDLEQQLKQLAFHDPLTGLANRSLFTERVDAAVRRFAEVGEEFAVLFIDLDDFKTVNDTLGHAAGDQLLCAVAERLGACTGSDDTASRLGGDEFAVLLNDTDIGGATATAERLVDALATPVRFGGQSTHVRASIGIALGSDAGRGGSADEVLRSADMAMYIAKSDGHGSYRVYEDAMRAEVVRRHRLKADLTRAVERGEFLVYYQPIVDVVSGRPVGFEALARWQHPELGLLAPDGFIKMAEETGQISIIGRIVLAQACTDLARWQSEFTGDPALWMSVNLAPDQVRSDGLVDQVADVLRRTKVVSGSLVLEITEDLTLQDPEATIETLKQLRALGVRLALDDFGTGYSSLGHLRALPVDVLKVAKTFVDDLDGHGESTAFAAAILALGHTLGLTTLAEGVEEPWQLAELLRIGCSLAQGYYFARPMPASDVSGWLASRLSPVAEHSNVIAFPAG